MGKGQFVVESRELKEKGRDGFAQKARKAEEIYFWRTGWKPRENSMTDLRG